MNAHKNPRIRPTCGASKRFWTSPEVVPHRKRRPPVRVSAVTRTWLGRYVAAGAAGLMDNSSRPARSPRPLAPHAAQAIVALQRRSACRRRSPRPWARPKPP